MVNEEVKLWDGEIPFAVGEEDKDIPTITPFLVDSDKPSGAVLIIPGGAYFKLAMEKEGIEVAEWLNSLGISAFILKYRLGGRQEESYKHPVMMHDAIRAIKYIRTHAESYNIDHEKIGIFGFSAGGHLACTAINHSDTYQENTACKVDQASEKVNFLLLGYPVVTFSDKKYTHQLSKRFLLGANHDESLTELLSSEQNLNHHFPPTFIFHTKDDSTVPYQNSELLKDAMKENKTSYQFHLYDEGKHGFGCQNKDGRLHEWTVDCEDWLNDLKII